MNKYVLLTETAEAIEYASKLQDKCLDNYHTFKPEMHNLLSKLEAAKGELRDVMQRAEKLEG